MPQFLTAVVSYRGCRLRHRLWYILESHFRQYVRVILQSLSLSQLLGQVQDFGPSGVIKGGRQRLQTRLLILFPCFGEPSVRGKGQGDPVGVVQQELLNQPRYVLGILAPFPNNREHRVQVQGRESITVVDCCAKHAQHQVEAVGHTVASQLPLLQFDLVQNGFKPIRGYSALRNVPYNVQCGGFKCFQVFRITALNAAAKDHFPHGFLNATQRGGRGAQLGGLQKLHQW